jgi:osmotically-inducible protein OsmY
MTDTQLQEQVQDALAWEPIIDPADIGVTVDQGVVTLRGDVATLCHREVAERATLGVYGVKAVANDLHVRIATAFERTDSEIALAVVSALKWTTTVPDDRVTTSVEDGRVTLRGTVDWQFQKEAAMRAVRELTGVRGVTNLITVTPGIQVDDLQEKIEAAFRRSAELDARSVRVGVRDRTVTLTGTVHSWPERLAAVRAVWAAPGVSYVDDKLAVVP